jgi:hypothetical protein
MQSREPCLANQTEFVEGFLAEGPGAGITCDPLCGGKVLVKMPKDLCQLIGGKHEAVGIPDENGTGPSPVNPVGRLDILDYFIQRPFLKRCILVHGAESTLVPRAPAGDS